MMAGKLSTTLISKNELSGETPDKAENNLQLVQYDELTYTLYEFLLT
jgi:hypothetical protein